MERIPQMNAHDFGGNRDSEGNRSYYEREIRSYDELSRGETGLISNMRYISRLEDSTEREERVIKFGHNLGEKMIKEMDASYDKKSLAVRGIPRAGAYFQQFVVKAALLGMDTRVFTDPSFIEALEESSDNFLTHTSGMESMVKGAENVFKYHQTLSADQDIIFTGLSIHLDTKHSVDLLIGRSEFGQPVEQIDLCEVKSSAPSQAVMANIHERHIDYVRAYKEIVVNGLGTLENKKKIERMRELDPKEFVDLAESRMSFVNDFIEVDKGLSEIRTWQDILIRAQKLSINPMLLVVRIRNFTPATMIHLRRTDRDELEYVRAKIMDVPIPTEELGLYHRLIKPENPHIGHALTWKSRVAFKDVGGHWKQDDLIIDKI